jgi:hypothetical protein
MADISTSPRFADASMASFGGFNVDPDGPDERFSVTLTHAYCPYSPDDGLGDGPGPRASSPFADGDPGGATCTFGFGSVAEDGSIIKAIGSAYVANDGSTIKVGPYSVFLCRRTLTV